MVKLYVEGGGDATALKTACREGFATFITNAGVKNRPRVVACGSRRDAYDSFCTAIANEKDAMLLVDSEAVILASYQQGDEKSEWLPWSHLKGRQGDGWEKPEGSVDNDCHLMVQLMESWFLADRGALTSFFGNGFNVNKLPALQSSIEGTVKADVYRALKDATKNCKTKSSYNKAEHSFKLLAKIDPTKVTNASGWAMRFIGAVKEKMDP